MECDWIVLCDHAYYDAAKKPCLIGIIDQIGSKTKPITHARMFAALRLSGNPNERETIELEIADESGNVIARVKGEAALSHIGVAHSFVQLAQITFRNWGIHSIKVSVSGKIKTSTFIVDRLP